MVGVAQLVEHLVVAQVAVGSSPITHPIKKMPGSARTRAFFFNPIHASIFTCMRNHLNYFCLQVKRCGFLPLVRC